MNAIRSKSILFSKILNLQVPNKLIKRCEYSNLIQNKNELKIGNESNQKSITNLYTIRTHNCGEISKKYLNQTVCLAGWVQFIRFGKFMVLRDKYGSVQLVIKDKQLIKKLKDSQINLKNLKLESVIIVKGQVISRPVGEENKSMNNGDIEIDVKEIDFINECDKELPINYNSIHKTPEDLCLKYRYVHLRSTNLQNNLQFRSDFVHKIRRFLIEQLRFIELETPTLFKNTPGGANEYVVPTRFKDKYYTLTQSPQQFKQLLMIASFDKYFQIARCYRDELTRSDRQPEFTQLDLELSFTTSEHIQQMIEDLLVNTWLDHLESIRTPFRKMSYLDCISKYGIDKPDLRLNLDIIDLSNQMNSESNDKAFVIKIKKGVHLDSSILDKMNIVIHEKLNHYSKSNKLDSYLIRTRSDKLVFEKIQATNDKLGCDEIKKDENLDKNNDLNPNNPKQSIEYVDFLKLDNLKIENLEEDDCLILCLGDLKNLKDVVGKIRNSIVPLILTNQQISEANGLSKDKYSFLWVVDFPLFTEDSEGNIESNHHPFTAPINEHQELIYKEPLKVIGQHYDLVLNGNEIAGGSIRIHDSKMQKYVFNNILKSDISQMNYFIEALNSGCPAHGGIAIGLDRLLSIMLETGSIRDVIAFPKTTFGRDLMSDAPNEISSESKLFYNLN